MNTAHKARLTALMAKTGTPALVESLRTLEAIPSRGPENTMVRAWVIDELEQRFPDASAAVEAAFDAAGDDGEVDYVAVLLANIPPAARG